VVVVPQGSLISPIWFSFTNLQIYHSRPRNLLSVCIWKGNSDMCKIWALWPRTNLLRLKLAKSMVLPRYRGHLLSHIEAKNLGITFNYDLS
jgi:hypothetical protein